MFDTDIDADGVRVVFTARAGGVSSGPWASLNLQTGGDDDPANVEQNFARLRAGLGADTAIMRQVHGADLVWVDEDCGVPTADAIATTQPGLALVVRVADCVPVLLHAVEAQSVAAVHAGRTGLLSGVVSNAVAALQRHGAQTIRAWIGPRACGACYELPADMADAVEHHVNGTRTTTRWGTSGADVGAGVARQLREAGVQVADIGAGRCTIEDEHLFSYRRQGARSGRFAGAVMLA